MTSRKVLCFGDSLTKGYYSNGFSYLPYSIILSRYFANINIQFIEKGVDGQCVINMEERLINILNNERYDYVILLGGLNDLGYGVPIDRIIDSFNNIYTVIDNNDSISSFFHITVPYNIFDNDKSCIKSILNTKIISNIYSKKRYIIDIGNYDKYRFNYLYLDTYHRNLYWDSDGLHFSPLGYEMLAKCIYMCFIENIIINQ
jgi:lysophospholipase L1-like esterase